MRKRLFESIKSGNKGGASGQWSARKAQMLAKQYKAKGGGYKIIMEKTNYWRFSWWLLWHWLHGI